MVKNQKQKPTGDSVSQLLKYINTVLDDIRQLKACRSRNPYVNKHIRIELAVAYNETKKCVEKILAKRPEHPPLLQSTRTHRRPAWYAS